MIIPNFPEYLSNLHHHWHVPEEHANEGLPGRIHPAGTPGAGLEFLTFHRSFMVQAFAWFATQTFSRPLDVSPWTAIPNELKIPELGWTAFHQAEEARILGKDPQFASADQLGTFIELGIHNNWIHGATATFFSEPVVSTFHSPQSTFFYKIHGLVDYWWSHWKIRGALPRPDEGIPAYRDPAVDYWWKQIRDAIFRSSDEGIAANRDPLLHLLSGLAPFSSGGGPPSAFLGLAERVELLELQVSLSETARGGAYASAQPRPGEDSASPPAATTKAERDP